MDLILCEFLPGTRTVKFAGANRPLYLIRQGELHIFNTDRFPIGGGQHDDKSFTTHTLETQPGDKLYLFTDGIVDQFGGPQRRKFTPKRLRELLLEIEPLPMAEQHARVRQAFAEWKGDQHQLDDVTLIGIEV
jgi:serine phosphatase RsbU (regulator of sigma subunit)